MDTIVASAGALTLKVSLFEGPFDRMPRQECVAWGDLLPRLLTHDERPRKDGPGWSPVSYRWGATRGIGGVELVHAAVADIDGGMSPRQFLAQVDGLEVVLHSTHSHTEAHPKFRAVFPLARPVSAGEWPETWAKIQAHVWKGASDPATKDASRLYYLPSCAPGEPRFAEHHSGTCLDPDSLPTALAEPRRAATVASTEKIPDGSRNSRLASIAGSLRRQGLGVEAIGEALLAINGAQCDPPLPDREVLGIARSVGRYDPQACYASKRTDLGNAERFVAQWGEDVRYCKAFGKWLIWQKTHWEVDETGQAERLAKLTVRRLWDEIDCADGRDERDEIARHASRSESSHAIASLLSLAQTESGIPIVPERLDTNPTLLTVPNGTLDLRAGELREHRREDYITKLIPVEYTRDSACPRFERFMDEIMGGDPALVGFLQRAVGYSLTGDTSERCIFILHGPGMNGKSTLLQVIDELLGGYAMKTPISTLLVKRNESVPNDIARLKGARFVFASEADEGKRLAEGTLKDLTGREKITARFMRGEFFEFIPEFKLWLGTNHKPVIRGTDKAIWDRIRLIPFEVRFKGRADNELPSKLRAELPGILSWAVRGCMSWREHGLGMPAKVAEAVEGYRREMDLVGQFLTESFEVTDRDDDKIASKDLYQLYKLWCWDNDEEPLRQTAFGQKLADRGGRQYRTKSERGWIGLKRRED